MEREVELTQYELDDGIEGEYEADKQAELAQDALTVRTETHNDTCLTDIHTLSWL